MPVSGHLSPTTRPTPSPPPVLPSWFNILDADETLTKFLTTILVEETQQPPEMAIAWWGPQLYTPPMSKSFDVSTFFFTSSSSLFLVSTLSLLWLSNQVYLQREVQCIWVFMMVWVKVEYLCRKVVDGPSGRLWALSTSSFVLFSLRPFDPLQWQTQPPFLWCMYLMYVSMMCDARCMCAWCIYALFQTICLW